MRSFVVRVREIANLGLWIIAIGAAVVVRLLYKRNARRWRERYEDGLRKYGTDPLLR